MDTTWLRVNANNFGNGIDGVYKYRKFLNELDRAGVKYHLYHKNRRTEFSKDMVYFKCLNNPAAVRNVVTNFTRGNVRILSSAPDYVTKIW